MLPTSEIMLDSQSEKVNALNNSFRTNREASTSRARHGMKALSSVLREMWRQQGKPAEMDR